MTQMMTYTIDVSVEDIKTGKRKQPGCCPVALALRRITGRPFIVGRYSCECNDPVNVIISLPEEVRLRIETFDRGRKIDPFSFMIKIPEFSS